MELLMAGALGAKELFSYNRENFKFDKDQQIEREALRLEMQVKRFELFREDVRDLVELTVDRMDVYHLVGALFLEFCVVLFCEGRVQASAPPFLLSLFLLSNACAFVYLLLAVWLSMHASIASHSFGVRLLTRFVRLPIPSMKTITSLRSTLKDYEKQGVASLLRLPFQDQEEWKQVHGVDETPSEETDVGLSAGSTAEKPKSFAPPGHSGGSTASSSKAAPARSGSQPAVSFSSPAPTSYGKHTPASGSGQPASMSSGQNLLPEEEQTVMGGEDLLSSSRGAGPERHVQLFRQLQSKWQCYDAYCRVCMGLGVNQILQALSYYCICHTLVENRSPTTGYALVTLFQSTTIALAVLDLAGLKRREILAVQVVGIMPCAITAWGVAHGKRDEYGVLDPSQTYILSPLSFLCQVLWLELWLRVAAPGDDQSKLPRRFRQVLFLDVFGDSSGWNPDDDNRYEDDRIEGEMFKELGVGKDGDNEDDGDDQALIDVAQRASSKLTMAQCGLRRWSAVPSWALSRQQSKELDSLKNEFKNWSNTIRAELERCCRLRGISEALRNLESELRPWSELSAEEQTADPFAGCLLGPFEHDDGYKTCCYHYEIETQRTLFDDNASTMCPGALVLSLQAVIALMKEVEEVARNLLELRIMSDLRVTMQRRAKQQELEKAKSKNTLLSAASPGGRLERTTSRAKEIRGSFPNLIGLFKQRLHQRRDGPERSELLAYDTPLSDQHHEGDTSAASAEFSQIPPVGGSADNFSVPEPPAAPAGQRDPTLVAMAGENAKHFVPEKLPWQVLRNITRVLQVCWFWSGLMSLLKEVHIYQVDFQQHPGGERRLCQAEDWPFQEIHADWPHGSFFRPQGLFCTRSKSGDIFVASPFAVYAAEIREADGAQTLHLSEVSRSRIPAKTTAACSAEPTAGMKGCLLLAASTNGLDVWQAGSARSLATTVPLDDGGSWKLVAGAVLRCSHVDKLLTAEELDAASWCLLLAGWDGSMLPVAAIPLKHGPDSLPAAGAVIRPGLDAPLQAADAKQAVVAMHLEPTYGRLWALLSSGELEAWNLLTAHSYGRWRPSWPKSAQSHRFHPVALCEDSHSDIMVLGSGGFEGESVLVRAQLPLSLRGDITSKVFNHSSAGGQLNV
eukprot:TRINITY_DN7563_c0_g3_i1.p1 TRINITY_DN7563_c0_g3~~TRINITY_DN7563_c0_g3_i1.p1  ORF type:complete len:1135 (+),score=186.80 TRINITY_DN7563_c0_g3_i1:47-3451(+)